MKKSIFYFLAGMAMLSMTSCVTSTLLSFDSNDTEPEFKVPQQRLYVERISFSPQAAKWLHARDEGKPTESKDTMEMQKVIFLLNKQYPNLFTSDVSSGHHISFHIKGDKVRADKQGGLQRKLCRMALSLFPSKTWLYQPLTITATVDTGKEEVIGTHFCHMHANAYLVGCYSPVMPFQAFLACECFFGLSNPESLDVKYFQKEEFLEQLAMTALKATNYLAAKPDQKLAAPAVVCHVEELSQPAGLTVAERDRLKTGYPQAYTGAVGQPENPLGQFVGKKFQMPAGPKAKVVSTDPKTFSLDGSWQASMRKLVMNGYRKDVSNSKVTMQLLKGGKLQVSMDSDKTQTVTSIEGKWQLRDNDLVLSFERMTREPPQVKVTSHELAESWRPSCRNYVVRWYDKDTFELVQVGLDAHAYHLLKRPEVLSSQAWYDKTGNLVSKQVILSDFRGNPERKDRLELRSRMVFKKQGQAVTSEHGGAQAQAK